MNVILLYVNKLFKENFDTIFMKNRKKTVKTLKKKKNQFLFIFIFFHKNFLKVILL